MSDKVLVRLGRGYYSGGITPLPNVCPTIDAHIDCWHILIGEKMEDIKCRVVGNLKDKRYNEMTSRVYSPNGLAPTIKTMSGGGAEPKIIMCAGGGIEDMNPIEKEILAVDGFNQSIRADQIVRIRKLTPKECGRLMGVRDEDIDKMQVNQSNSSLYHCFGDSIVCDVLMAIFKQML